MLLSIKCVTSFCLNPTLGSAQAGLGNRLLPQMLAEILVNLLVECHFDLQKVRCQATASESVSCCFQLKNVLQDCQHQATLGDSQAVLCSCLCAFLCPASQCSLCNRQPHRKPSSEQLQVGQFLVAFNRIRCQCQHWGMLKLCSAVACVFPCALDATR